MRKLCIFGAHHQFQADSLMDSAYNQRLRELIQDHRVDCILEEATGLPPKSCVEALADKLGIRWANMDLTVEQRKDVPDSALTGKGLGHVLRDSSKAEVYTRMSMSLLQSRPVG